MGSPVIRLLTVSTTSLYLPSVSQMLHSVFLSLTFTTSRELVKLSAELSNKELSDLVTKLDLFRPISRVRKFSPLNSTRRFSTRLDLVTRLVCPSRVLRRMKRSILVILSTTKRRENSSQSRASPPWLPSKSIRVSSSLDTALLSSLVPQRLLARRPRSCGRWVRRLEARRSKTLQSSP